MTPCPLDPGDLSLPVLDSRECDLTARLLWEYLDQELWLPERRTIELHLARCAPCHARVAFGRRLLDTMHATRPPAQDTADLAQRVREALRRKHQSIDDDT